MYAFANETATTSSRKSTSIEDLKSMQLYLLGGLGGFTFGMPKIDTSTFSGMHKVDTSTFSGFGQPIQNGQPAQSAVNGGFQSLSSMTGAQSTPSEQTLSILGQAAAVGAPSVGFGAGG